MEKDCDNVDKRRQGLHAPVKSVPVRSVAKRVSHDCVNEEIVCV